MSTCFLTFQPSNPEEFQKVCYDSASISYLTNFTEDVASTNSLSFFDNFSSSFDINAVWLLITAALVFSLQAGFTFIQCSYIKQNRIQIVLFRNLIAMSICAIVFYIVGYSMAFGKSSGASTTDNRFMGVENILIEDRTFTRWFFEFMFLAASSIIASGSISHRATTVSYVIFAVCYSAWIYPVIAYWCWGQDGWLSPYSADPKPFGGLMDWSGSGVVNMVGGFTAIMATLFLGNRAERFDDRISTEEQHATTYGHTIPFQVFGTLLIWFGWYGFNCGRTLAATGVMQIASKVAVTTTLSAGTAGLTVITFTRLVEGKWSVTRLCDGILCGLVAISSPCNVIDCGFAILIGFLAIVVYYSGVWFLKWIEIDDPMNTFMIHGIVGGFGLLAAGLFATDENIRFGYSAYDVPQLIEVKKSARFATQIAGMLVISIWTMLNCILIFGLMHFFGYFRENSNNSIHETKKKNHQMSYDEEADEKHDTMDDGQK